MTRRWRLGTRERFRFFAGWRSGESADEEAAEGALNRAPASNASAVPDVAVLGREARSTRFAAAPTGISAASARWDNLTR